MRIVGLNGLEDGNKHAEQVTHATSLNNNTEKVTTPCSTLSNLHPSGKTIQSVPLVEMSAVAVK